MREIDFVLSKDDELQNAIEVKLNRSAISKSFKYFKARFKKVKFTQVILNLRNRFDIDDIEVVPADEWLMGLEV